MSAWRPPRTSESSGASNRPSRSNIRLQPATKLHSLLAAHPLVSSYSLYSLLAHRRRWDKNIDSAYNVMYYRSLENPGRAGVQGTITATLCCELSAPRAVKINSNYSANLIIMSLGLSCCRQLSSVLVWLFGELSGGRAAPPPAPQAARPPAAQAARTPIHQLFSDSNATQRLLQHAHIYI
ncbi:hypothetical protein MSG28_006066 [Choristoneura fumiferana]|uniref:Uncharacterized protein n=1 Tax=Choristoneura fumiferana TaxID=7141 RepID=A0ACC0JDG8_CHOFU|nr:hypothetical protein MSG28_006066 [Choristoneura fumiferana]